MFFVTDINILLAMTIPDINGLMRADICQVILECTSYCISFAGHYILYIYNASFLLTKSMRITDHVISMFFLLKEKSHFVASVAPKRSYTSSQNGAEIFIPLSMMYLSCIWLHGGTHLPYCIFLLLILWPLSSKNFIFHQN